MTKIKILPITLIAIIFFSCTKDAEENILGTWDMIYTASYNGYILGEYTGTADFQENGTGSWLIRIGETNNLAIFSWSLNGDKLTIVDGDQGQSMNLDVITNKKNEQEWRGTLEVDNAGLDSLDVLFELSR